MSKYRWVTYEGLDGQKIVTSISSYAGKTVKGHAKCDPLDEFSLDKGRSLATARCDEKIAKRRVKRAKHCFEDAKREYDEALKHLQDMCVYYSDAVERLNEAKRHTENVLKSI